MLFDLKKKEKPVDKKTLLKRIAISKLNYLSRKRFGKGTIEDIYWILKVFFNNYFNIKGEVAYTEFINKIKKKKIEPQIKERIIGLINFFLGVKYKNKKYMLKDLRKVVKEAKGIIKAI